MFITRSSKHTAGVMLYCRKCSTTGVAFLDPERQSVRRLSRRFRAEAAGEIGLQFLCTTCSRVAGERRGRTG